MANKSNIGYTAPEVVITGKMTRLAKQRAATRLIEAFKKARAARQRYFYFNGKWYTTLKRGETKEQWWNNTIDNITASGSHNVQTDLSLGWEGGDAGQYAKTKDGKVKWVKFTGNSNSGPVGARGAEYNPNLGYALPDLPNDQILITIGTDRGKAGTNPKTTITIGKPGDDGLAERPKTNSEVSLLADQKVGNWDAADFVDAILPTNAIANGVSYLIDKMTGTEYTPYIAKSGFNPFGYAKDLAKGNIGNLLLRGVDAYATLGAPGLSKAIDYLGTRFAPKIISMSEKSKYLPEKALTPSGELTPWAPKPLQTFDGLATGEIGRRAMQIAPYETALTDIALQQINGNK